MLELNNIYEFFMKWRWRIFDALRLSMLIPMVIYGSWEWWVAGIFFMLPISVLGSEIAAHRYICHHAFDCGPIWDKILKLAATLVVSKPPSLWSYVHLTHHKHSDKEGDPHDPARDGFWRLAFHYYNVEVDLVRTKVHCSDKFLDFCDEYPLRIAFVVAFLLFLIHPLAPLFFYALPTMYCHHAGSYLINYSTHKSFGGYRTYDTDDKSYNVPWVWPLAAGIAWHHNHHAFPDSYRTGFKPWEIDLEAWFIKNVIKGTNLKEYKDVEYKRK